MNKRFLVNLEVSATTNVPNERKKCPFSNYLLILPFLFLQAQRVVLWKSSAILDCGFLLETSDGIDY